MTYVAPVHKKLTVLHVQDQSAAAVTTGPHPATGCTACCQRPMLVEENWVPVDRLPGDRLCGGEEPAPEPEIIEVGLW